MEHCNKTINLGNDLRIKFLSWKHFTNQPIYDYRVTYPEPLEAMYSPKSLIHKATNKKDSISFYLIFSALKLTIQSLMKKSLQNHSLVSLDYYVSLKTTSTKEIEDKLRKSNTDIIRNVYLQNKNLYRKIISLDCSFEESKLSINSRDQLIRVGYLHEIESDCSQI